MTNNKKSYNIEIMKYPRAKIGYYHLSKLIASLGEENSNIQFVYLFDSRELIITDKKIIDKLNYLKVPYTYVDAINSITYIKE